MSTAAICRIRDAAVPIEDRGFQFADGVYEVCEVRGGRLIDERRHMARLERSLRELRIALPMPLAALKVVLRETVQRNRVHDGIVYLQVTRGAAPRDFPFPREGTAADRGRDRARQRSGQARRAWRRRVFRSSPCRTSAGSASISNPSRCCRTCWPSRRRGTRARVRPGSSTRDGYVTEGGSSNAWIVTADGVLVTRPLGNGILPGMTRSVVRRCARRQELTLEERAFTVEEAYAAREAFVTSASQIVMPVVRIDGRPVGSGRPGPIAMALRRDFYATPRST